MKQVKIEFEDGKTFECVPNPKTWDGHATRAAFKREFGIPLDFLSMYSSVFVQTEDDDRELDPSRLSSEQIAMLPDMQVALAFMAWMELKRRCEGVPDGKWDKVLDQIVDVELDPGDDDEENPM